MFFASGNATIRAIGHCNGDDCSDADCDSPTYGNAKSRSYGRSSYSGDYCRYAHCHAHAYTHTAAYSHARTDADCYPDARPDDGAYANTHCHTAAYINCYPNTCSNGDTYTNADVYLGQNGQNRLPGTLRSGHNTAHRSCRLGSEASNFRQRKTFSNSPNPRWTQSDTA